MAVCGLPLLAWYLPCTGCPPRPYLGMFSGRILPLRAAQRFAPAVVGKGSLHLRMTQRGPSPWWGGNLQLPERDPSDQCPRGSQSLRARPTDCAQGIHHKPAESPGPGSWTLGAREQGSQVGGHPENMQGLPPPPDSSVALGLHTSLQTRAGFSCLSTSGPPSFSTLGLDLKPLVSLRK